MSIHHTGNHKGCKHETFARNIFLYARIDILFTLEKIPKFFVFYTTKLTIKVIKFRLLRFTVHIEQDFEPNENINFLINHK